MNNPVVLDNTVLTNFALVNRADLILQLWPGATCMTPPVYDEFQIVVENQGLPANCWAGLPVIELNEAETQLAENLPKNLDPGERTCLALAINRKGLLASDDLAARRTAVPPLSMVYNFSIEGNDKIVGFDSMRRRKSPLNEEFTGNPCDSDLMC